MWLVYSLAQRGEGEFMKARREGGWGWKPFDVVLTVESEEEARALYAIFNYCPNTDILSDDASKEIREAIGQKYADLGPDTLIARGVHYEKFYQTKKENGV